MRCHKYVGEKTNTSKQPMSQITREISKYLEKMKMETQDTKTYRVWQK